MTQPAFFHEDSGRVRFWVDVDGVDIGATVSRDTLHYRYTAQMTGEDPMATFRSHVSHLEDAVRRRVANGSLEPVMLRESDLPPEAGDPARR